MVVGDDVTATGIDHHPGTDALRLAFARLIGNVEEVAKEWIIQ